MDLEALAIEVGLSFPANRVVSTLEIMEEETLRFLKKLDAPTDFTTLVEIY